MIGWINLSVQSFVIKTFGEEAWNQIVAESGVECAWVSSCPYPDKVTYDLVITAANILNVPVPAALEAYGVYFVQYVTEQGYTKLLKTLGSDIVEFLSNLNNLHLHLTNGQPAMDAPAFRVDNVTTKSCHLHYYSRRPALWPIVVGVLKGLSKEYLKFDLNVTLLESRDSGSDHEVFLVEYPEQPSLKTTLAQQPTTAATHTDTQGTPTGGVPGASGPGGVFALTAKEFADLHPFHMLLDKECCIVQFGSVLPKLVPGIAKGVNINDLFMLRHPHTGLTWDGIVRETASSYVLQVAKTGLEIKGQMIPSSMPVPGCPVAKPVMLFMGSPRCANLDAMIKYGLYLSDIPLHDLSRDFVLLAEQRQAEADLKEMFEKLTLDLKAEKARSDALVQRMSGLLACFPFAAKGGGSGTTPGTGNKKETSLLSSTFDEADDAFGHMEVIEAVRRTLGHMNLKQSADDQVEIVKAIGEGTYGRVYRGLWHGTEVAIKTIILPAGMSGAQKREKMAVMEAAISSSLSHPNIVQTYTYSIRPMRDSAVVKSGKLEDATNPLLEAVKEGSDHTGSGGLGGSMGHSSTLTGSVPNKGKGGAVHSYEVRLVLELCEKGSLRDALEQRAFLMHSDDPSGTTLINYAAILDTAADVAKACIHLHRNGVIHSDLKARNVLLRGDGGRGVGRGVTAKLGDFGLALRLPEGESHMSGMFQGTLTHMAPETLLDGRVSKASDVYAFGIMLWELYTGDHAFKGVPKTLLGHQVTVEHRRPEFPGGTPPKYKQLAAWCWNKDVHVRPTFEEVLSTLLLMRKELGGPTPPMGAIRPSFASEDGTGEQQAMLGDSQAAGGHYTQETSTANNTTARLPQLVSAQLAPEESLSYEPTDSEEGSWREEESD